MAPTVDERPPARRPELAQRAARAVERKLRLFARVRIIHAVRAPAGPEDPAHSAALDALRDSDLLGALTVDGRSLPRSPSRASCSRGRRPPSAEGLTSPSRTVCHRPRSVRNAEHPRKMVRPRRSVRSGRRPARSCLAEGAAAPMPDARGRVSRAAALPWWVARPASSGPAPDSCRHLQRTYTTRTVSSGRPGKERRVTAGAARRRRGEAAAPALAQKNHRAGDAFVHRSRERSASPCGASYGSQERLRPTRVPCSVQTAR